MSVLEVSRFLALLALATAAGALLLGTQLVTGRGPRDHPLRGRGALTAGAAVAAVSTAGSLYYSEVAGFVPCLLCWYQRIAMYPLVVVLGVGAWRNDPDVRFVALPLATIGAAVSGYHYLIQQVPSLAGDTCAVGVPCTAAYVWQFGFVSIPLMALAGFFAVIVLSLSSNRS